jgi:hypothetical protein
MLRCVGQLVRGHLWAQGDGSALDAPDVHRPTHSGMSHASLARVSSGSMMTERTGSVAVHPRVSVAGTEDAAEQQAACSRNLMQLAVDSKRDSCVQAVAEALRQRGAFSDSSMRRHLEHVLHLLHSQQRHRQLFISLLQDLQLLQVGRVEVHTDPRALIKTKVM